MPTEREVLKYLEWLKEATISDEGEDSPFLKPLTEVINLIECMAE